MLEVVVAQASIEGVSHLRRRKESDIVSHKQLDSLQLQRSLNDG